MAELLMSGKSVSISKFTILTNGRAPAGDSCESLKP